MSKQWINYIILINLIDSEEGFGSFYEYIYSFRNNTNEPFPRITNPEVEEAMEHLMLMKEEFGGNIYLFFIIIIIIKKKKI